MANAAPRPSASRTRSSTGRLDDASSLAHGISARDLALCANAPRATRRTRALDDAYPSPTYLPGGTPPRPTRRGASSWPGRSRRRRRRPRAPPRSGGRAGRAPRPRAHAAGGYEHARLRPLPRRRAGRDDPRAPRIRPSATHGPAATRRWRRSRRPTSSAGTSGCGTGPWRYPAWSSSRPASPYTAPGRRRDRGPARAVAVHNVVGGGADAERFLRSSTTSPPRPSGTSSPSARLPRAHARAHEYQSRGIFQGESAPAERARSQAEPAAADHVPRAPQRAVPPAVRDRRCSIWAVGQSPEVAAARARACRSIAPLHNARRVAVPLLLRAARVPRHHRPDARRPPPRRWSPATSTSSPKGPRRDGADHDDAQGTSSVPRPVRRGHAARRRAVRELLRDRRRPRRVRRDEPDPDRRARLARAARTSIGWRTSPRWRVVIATPGTTTASS